MNNDTFQWTDELVQEFAGIYEYGANDTDLKAFKQSKMPKKEWEIIEGKQKHGGPHNWVLDSAGENSCLSKGCNIHSVRRLTDNEVWTIGDEFYDNAHPHLKRGVISGFYVITKQTNLQGDLVCAISDEGNIGKMAVLEKGHALPKHLFDDIRKVSSEQPKKERIEVSQYSKINIPEEKFPAIKAALERVLNDELEDAENLRNILNTTIECYEKILKEAEEKAFNAAREPYCETAMGQRPKYWTFQDYINHQRDKK